MRILLDECIPRKFCKFLSGHEVKTVVEVGWKGIKNGDLLKRAVPDFDVFISVDRNIAFQQNLSNLPIPTIVIHSKSIRLQDLKPFAPDVLDLLQQSLSNGIYRLG